MRYPLNAHRKELADAEGAREREKELAKEIQEGELDDEDLDLEGQDENEEGEEDVPMYHWIRKVRSYYQLRIQPAATHLIHV